MMRRTIVLIGVILFFWPSLCFSQTAEEITITTYYPSPHGVYNTLIANTVGIGTTTPSTLLHVGSPSPPAFNGGDTTDIQIASVTNTPGANNMLLLDTYNLGNDTGIILATPQLFEDAAIFLDESDARKLKFSIGDVDNDANRNGSAQMTIDQSGRVGIGTTAPGSKLHILDSSGSHTELKITAPTSDDPYINFDITAAQDFSIGIDNSDGDKFKITSHSSLAANERLVITPAGNVGIGDSTPTEAKLVVRGGTVAGEGAYLDLLSHSSLKESYKDVFVLDKVVQLNLKEWQYKSEIVQKRGADPYRHLFPFADDFYNLFGLGRDGQSISSMDVAGVALRGVQELNEIIKELKVENEALKQRIETLEKG